MPIYEYEGKRPDIHPQAWIAPTAPVVGDVRIAAGVSIWYGAVLRGDVGPIVIGEGTNVQDNSVLHVVSGSSLEIGEHSTVAHGCVVHGHRIGDRTLIGNGAVVLDGTVIGSGCFVAAGALVLPQSEIPDGSLVVGFPATVKGPVEGTAADILARNAAGYRRLMERHRDTLVRVDAPVG